MSVLSYCADTATRAGKRLLELATDNRGVAALEFALIAPLLLAMYFVTIEVSQGIETNKKLGRVASTVADLITQQQETSASQLVAIMAVGKEILSPYARSDLKIAVTAIEVTDEETPKVKIAWSKASPGTPETCVFKLSELPVKLQVKGTYLIHVRACLDYKPVITWAAGKQQETGLGVMDKIFNNGVMKMKESYYLRPRMSPTIPCSGC